MPKNSQQVILRRYKAITEIMEECVRDNVTPSNMTILKRLEHRKIKISYWQLCRDIAVVNQENSFLRDLGESNYSAMLQRTSDNLDRAETEAWEKYNAEWTTTRSRERETPKGTFTEEETTKNDASAKAKFLEIFVLCQKTRLEMLKGDNILISVDMLSKKLNQVKEERDGLKIQLARAQNGK